MIMYWGDNEATKAISQFLIDYKQHMHLLISYRPISYGHEALVPGLVLRYFHAYMNLWVHQQLTTDQVVTFPTGVHDIWTMLALHSPMWEHPFPTKYITSAAPLPGATPVHPTVVSGGSSVPSGGAAAAPTLPKPRTQETHCNLYPNNNEAEFKVFRVAMVGKKFRKIIQDGIAAGYLLPQNHRGEEMCVPFHVLGNCTSYCSRRNDHNGVGNGNLTKADDDALLKWCKACIPVP
jgi:hypothetical protein